jgi:hypothetical protein
MSCSVGHSPERPRHSKGRPAPCAHDNVRSFGKLLVSLAVDRGPYLGSYANHQTNDDAILSPEAAAIQGLQRCQGSKDVTREGLNEDNAAKADWRVPC